MLSGRDVAVGDSRSNQAQNRIRAFAFVISSALCILLCGYFVVSSLYSCERSSVIELDDKINPNDASAASLARLPGIGIVRAEAIATYRENFKKETGGNCAFRDCNDLQKVKGIGAKTVQDIKKWLKFE